MDGWQIKLRLIWFISLRSFLHHAGRSLHLLFIQMDLEESQCSDELIASAKWVTKSPHNVFVHSKPSDRDGVWLSINRYCTMNYVTSLEDGVCWVIFIIKVSRISSQSEYIGFQGGKEPCSSIIFLRAAFGLTYKGHKLCVFLGRCLEFSAHR